MNIEEANKLWNQFIYEAEHPYITELKMILFGILVLIIIYSGIAILTRIAVWTKKQLGELQQSGKSEERHNAPTASPAYQTNPKAIRQSQQEQATNRPQQPATTPTARRGFSVSEDHPDSRYMPKS